MEKEKMESFVYRVSRQINPNLSLSGSLSGQAGYGQIGETLSDLPRGKVQTITRYPPVLRNSPKHPHSR